MSLTRVTPEQLLRCLLGCLDEESNVTNDVGAIEAIKQWEQFPVTKEILESTRIGKYVNELRKRTTNQELSRRAKGLIRKWQNAPAAAASIVSAVVNGQYAPSSVTPTVPVVNAPVAAVLNGHTSSIASSDDKGRAPVTTDTRQTLPLREDSSRLSSQSLRDDSTRLASSQSLRDDSKHVRDVKKPRQDLQHTGPRPPGLTLTSGPPPPTHQPTAGPRPPEGQLAPSQRPSSHQGPVSGLRSSGHQPTPGPRSSGAGSRSSTPSPLISSTLLSVKPTTPSLSFSRGVNPSPATVSSPQLSFDSPAVPTPPSRSELKLKLKRNASGLTTVHNDHTVLSHSQPPSLSSDGSRSNSPVVIGGVTHGRAQHRGAPLDPRTTLDPSYRTSSPTVGPPTLKESRSSPAVIPGKQPVKLNGSKSIPDLSTLVQSNTAPVKNGHVTAVANGGHKRYANGSIKDGGSVSSGTPGGSEESAPKRHAWADGLGVTPVVQPVIKNGQMKTARSVGDFKTVVHSPTVVEPPTPVRNAKKAKRLVSDQATLLRQNSSSSLVLMGGSTEGARVPPPPPYRTTSSSGVESTAALMTRLHSEGNLSLVRSDVIERIATNRITREKDDDVVVAPTAAKPRGGKNKKDSYALLPPTLPAAEMARVKTEMVHKFLQTSVPSTSPPDALPSASTTANGCHATTGFLDRLKPETIVEALPSSSKQEHRKNGKHKNNDKTKSETLSSTTAAKKNKSESNAVVEVVNKEPSIEEAAWAQLLPIDPFFDYHIDTAPVPPRFKTENITEEDIEHLHKDNIPGVNGHYDMVDWRNWTQSMSFKIDDSRFLHILPYVLLD